MTADHVRALRHARDLVSDMRWQGVAVPPLYARMAGEFQDLVRTGDYAAWSRTAGPTGPGPFDGRARLHDRASLMLDICS